MRGATVNSSSLERYRAKLLAFADMGRRLTDLSTCTRAHVSVIIFPVDCTSVHAIGYNGPARGENNDACTGIEDACGCVHAEANALVKLRATDRTPLLLFSTRCPCSRCAGLIINSGLVAGVMYDESYRNDDGYYRLRQQMHVLKMAKIDAETEIVSHWYDLKHRWC